MQCAARTSTNAMVASDTDTNVIAQSAPLMIHRERLAEDDSLVRDDVQTVLMREVIGLNVKENEKSLILKALEECGGNRSQAAIKLNISRRTLYRKLHEYGFGGDAQD